MRSRGDWKSGLRRARTRSVALPARMPDASDDVTRSFPRQQAVTAKFTARRAARVRGGGGRRAGRLPAVSVAGTGTGPPRCGCWTSRMQGGAAADGERLVADPVELLAGAAVEQLTAVERSRRERMREFRRGHHRLRAGRGRPPCAVFALLVAAVRRGPRTRGRAGARAPRLRAGPVCSSEAGARTGRRGGVRVGRGAARRRDPMRGADALGCSRGRSRRTSTYGLAEFCPGRRGAGAHRGLWWSAGVGRAAGGAGRRRGQGAGSGTLWTLEHPERPRRRALPLPGGRFCRTPIVTLSGCSGLDGRAAGRWSGSTRLFEYLSPCGGLVRARRPAACRVSSAVVQDRAPLGARRRPRSPLPTRELLAQADSGFWVDVSCRAPPVLERRRGGLPFTVEVVDDRYASSAVDFRYPSPPLGVQVRRPGCRPPGTGSSCTGPKRLGEDPRLRTADPGRRLGGLSRARTWRAQRRRRASDAGAGLTSATSDAPRTTRDRGARVRARSGPTSRSLAAVPARSPPARRCPGTGAARGADRGAAARRAPAGPPLPVLLDPYGGPHAQRVLAARNAYLESQWLADQGFAVVVADGRGTPAHAVVGARGPARPRAARARRPGRGAARRGRRQPGPRPDPRRDPRLVVRRLPRGARACCAGRTCSTPRSPARPSPTGGSTTPTTPSATSGTPTSTRGVRAQSSAARRGREADPTAACSSTGSPTTTSSRRTRCGSRRRCSPPAGRTRCCRCPASRT